MPRALKWGLIAVGGVIGVVVIAAIVAVALFDSNAAKRRIVDAVAQRTGRTLDIQGDLRISVFPTIGVSLGKTTLSEPKSPQVAASVQSAKLSVALLPLLRKQLQVDRVMLDGVSATLIRGKDGKTNFDDLLNKDASAPKQTPAEQASGQAPAFDIAGIDVTRSSFAYRDAASGTDVSLSNVNLKTGRLADGVQTPLDASLHVEGKQPAVAGDFKAKGKLTFELAAKRYTFESFDASWNGRVAQRTLDATVGAKTLRLALNEPAYAARDVKLALKGTQDRDGFDVNATVPELDITPNAANAREIRATVKMSGARTVDANLRIDRASGNAKALQAQIALDAKGSEAHPAGERKFNVALATPLAADLATLAFDLPKLAGNIEIDDPALPMKKLAMPIDGRLKAEVNAQRVNGAINTRYENAPASLSFNVAGFTKPRIEFDLNAQTLDIDKLAPPAPKSAANAPAPSTPNQGAAKPSASSNDAPLDLSALKSIDVNGKVRIGSLVARGIKASNLNMGVAVRDGLAKLAPFTLALYGGTAEGSASVNANGNRIAIDQRLTNVQLGPLLRDAAQLDKLEGRGNVALDVNGAGATVGAIKRSLGGNASVRVTDGALKGIDYAKRLREWRTRIRDLRSIGRVQNEKQASNAAEQTAFSELSATFQIAGGVANNKDLLVKAPLVRLNGTGAIDIGNDRIDYVVDASLVNTLTGQGGKDLGKTGVEVTVPVRVVGPLAQPEYEVLWAKAAGSALKGTIDQLTRPPQPGESNDPAKLLQDRFKGLFKR